MTAPIKRLLDELVPYDVAGQRKVRFGPRRDGGYVLIDVDLEHVDTLYSFGVGRQIRFDLDFVTRTGARARLFDHTIAGIPRGVSDPRLIFEPRGIGPSRTGNIDTLEGHIAATGDHGKRLLLKMDVEGAEWDALAATPPEVLALFDQIVIEVHGLDAVADVDRRVAVLRKLNALFWLHHVHANNHSPVHVIDGYKVPAVLELSYLKKHPRFTAAPTQTSFPTPLDFPCHRFKQEIRLDFWPFVTADVLHPPFNLRGRLREALKRSPIAGPYRAIKRWWRARAGRR